LRELGYVEGRNLAIDFVHDNDLDRLAAAVGEMARRRVDVLVIGGQDEVIRAAVTRARSVPVVTTAVDSDPLGKGHIASLSHPGGNLTGVVFQQLELIAKRLDLLTQAVPHIARIVLLYDSAGVDQAEAAKRSAAALGTPLEPIQLRGIPYDYEHALAETDGARGDALMVTSSPFGRTAAGAEAALRHRLPSIGPVFIDTPREAGNRSAEAGYLMSYGPNFSDMFRLAADYVDKILRGAKPADLPVQQPTKFELIVKSENRKDARPHGSAVDPGPRRRGDRMTLTTHCCLSARNSRYLHRNQAAERFGLLRCRFLMDKET
jgi:putative ABC transport system substrate-binding protein